MRAAWAGLPGLTLRPPPVVDAGERAAEPGRLGDGKASAWGQRFATMD